MGLAAGIALALPGPFRSFFLETNLRDVVPGEIYRSAQPTPERLGAWIDELGLRTVVNLRGDRGDLSRISVSWFRDDSADWLPDQEALAASRGVEMHTVRLHPKRHPPQPRLVELVRILDEAPRPLLFHCQGGAERSGLIGAVAVLLEGGSLDTARAQFAVLKGYVHAISRSELPEILDLYAEWLAAEGLDPTPAHFRRWVERDYAPYFYRARLELLEPLPELTAGEATSLRVRVANDSRLPIPFRADRMHGVHLGARVFAPGAPEDAPAAHELRSGFVDLDLPPGDATELTLDLPALDRPGRWRIELDLVDEGIRWFAFMGSPPLPLTLDVTPPPQLASPSRTR